MSDMRSLERSSSGHRGERPSSLDRSRREAEEAKVRSIARSYLQAAGSNSYWPKPGIHREEGYNKIIDYIDSAVRHELVSSEIGERALIQLRNERDTLRFEQQTLAPGQSSGSWGDSVTHRQPQQPDTQPVAGPSRDARDTAHEIDKDKFLQGMQNMYSHIEFLRDTSNKMQFSKATLEARKASYLIANHESNRFLLSLGLISNRAGTVTRLEQMPEYKNVSASKPIDYAIRVRNALNDINPRENSTLGKIRKNINDLYERCRIDE